MSERGIELTMAHEADALIASLGIFSDSRGRASAVMSEQRDLCRQLAEALKKMILLHSDHCAMTCDCQDEQEAKEVLAAAREKGVIE